MRMLFVKQILRMGVASLKGGGEKVECLKLLMCLRGGVMYILREYSVHAHGLISRGFSDNFGSFP
jgi:hypothetical protein